MNPSSSKILVPEAILASGEPIKVLVQLNFDPPQTGLSPKDFEDRRAYREALIRERQEQMSRYLERTRILQAIGAILGEEFKTPSTSLFLTIKPHQVLRLAELKEVKFIVWGDEPMNLIEPVK